MRPIAAAELLGITSRQVYDLVDDGRLAAARDEKGRLVVSEADVDARRVS